MNSFELTKVEKVFSVAVDLEKDQRDEFLDQTCQGDEKLRAQVKALLHADSEPKNDLDTQVGLAWKQYQEHQQLNPGDTIDSFEIIKTLGTGGMGSVYLAKRQHDEFEQLVALKVLRSDVGDTQQLYERFVQEQRLLANLNHPYITQLFDTGKTETGQCFLAMEYVDGIPLDKYCNSHRLSYQDRLLLLEKVCEAVHFAHSRFIVHQDIKPSNVLVTKDGLPKLLDFGIAMLLDTNESLGAIAWQHDQLFTPNYASPELLAGEAVTTSTDVYALGAVTYKLLAGQVAHDISKLSLKQALGVLCNEAPKPPSASLKAHQDKASNDLPYHQIPSELDKIVLKAIAKEPDDRYQSVLALRDDFVRLRTNQIVIAANDSSWYRTRKWMSRYSLFLSITLFIIIGLLIVNFVIKGERDRSRKAEQLAEQRFQQTQQVTGHLLDAYREAGQRNTELTATDILDQSFKQLQSNDELPKALVLDIYLTIGRAYRDIQQFESAEKAIQQAIIIAQNLGSAEIERLALAHTEMTIIKADFESLEAARVYLQQAEKLLQYLPEDSIAAGITYTYLTIFDLFDGYYEEAQRNVHRALAIFAKHPDEARRERFEALLSLAELEAYMGNSQEAFDIFDSVADFYQQQYGENSLLLADIFAAYTNYLTGGGWLEEAEDIASKAIAIYKIHLDPADNIMLYARDQLGQIYFEQGKLDEARQMYLRSLELRENSTTPIPNWSMVIPLTILGRVHFSLEDFTTAELYLSRAYTMAQKVELLSYKLNVAARYSAVLRVTGQTAKGRQLLQQVLNEMKHISPEHNDLRLLEVELARIEIIENDIEIATERLSGLRENISGLQSDRYWITYIGLLEAEADLAVALDDTATAISKLNEAINTLSERYPEANPYVQRLKKALANIKFSH